MLPQTALHAAAAGPLAYRVEPLEGRAAFDALGSYAGIEVAERGGEPVEIVRSNIGTNVSVAGSQGRAVQGRCDSANDHVADTVSVQRIEDDPWLKTGHARGPQVAPRARRAISSNAIMSSRYRSRSLGVSRRRAAI